ncbi:MAG: SPOR domain-containing protein [Thiobacillus sp.]
MPAPINEDDLKRRARRRLIGAVALTLVAVIVLPLMLEDEPPPGAHLQVHMPAHNKTRDFVPITPLVPPAAPVTQAPAPDSSPTPDETKITKAPREDLTPMVEQKPKPAVLEQKPKPVVAAEVKKPTKPNPAPKIESKPIDEKSPAYVVQLGAFSDAAKTADLKQRVDDLGMSGYTEKSGALIRVRVGPFATREAAASAAAKLSAAGVQGQVMPK